MIPEARLTHAIPGRFRFKFPVMRRDAHFFAALAEEMPNAPGVTSVRVNAIACSLLIRCDPRVTPEAIAEYAAERKLFVLEPFNSTLLSLLSALMAGLGAVNRKLRTPNGERYDKRAALLLLLVALAIRQTLRGEIMVPALPLWWNAYTLLNQMDDTGDAACDRS